METHTLLIDCPDRTGLVHRITGVLLSHGLNIITNAEFVDPACRHFFMRTEFSGDCRREQVEADLARELPDARIRLVRPRPKRIVVLVTREPHCLGDLLIRHAYGELRARIMAVVGNHPVLRPLAEKFDVPFHYVPHEGLSREEHEARILEVVTSHEPEYLVLAKYMRVLTKAFVDRFPERIVNIHHSFLPAFAGASPYRQAAERGVKIIGATAHFVTENLDEGPIIAQDVIPVDHTQDAAALAQAGRDVEKVVLARALKLVFEERVFVIANRTVIFR
ncbi:MAG: formyltetrahydrofolate deformylase [Acidobacteriota bacterium]